MNPIDRRFPQSVFMYFYWHFVAINSACLQSNRIIDAFNVIKIMKIRKRSENTFIRLNIDLADEISVSSRYNRIEWAKGSWCFIELYRTICGQLDIKITMDT